jgi:hypothetical protein
MVAPCSRLLELDDELLVQHILSKVQELQPVADACRRLCKLVSLCISIKFQYSHRFSDIIEQQEQYAAIAAAVPTTWQVSFSRFVFSKSMAWHVAR